MKQLFKISFVLIIYLIIINLVLPYIVPTSWIYDYRVKYEVFKDTPETIVNSIQAIKRTIEKENLKEYIIVFGDSVGYSTPADQYGSIGYYMNKKIQSEGKVMRVFNLSIPSEYPGDIYVLLKLLDKYQISTDNIIINVTYLEFLLDKNKSGVFWLKNYLWDVDKDAYKYVYRNEKPNVKKLTLRGRIKHIAYSNVNILNYKDFVRNKLVTFTLFDKKNANENILPWYKKEYLINEVRKPANKWMFSDKPVDMSEGSNNTYFLNKIIEHQEGKHTLIFLSALNRELLNEEVAKKGFVENLEKIDAYFESKPIMYVNYDKMLDYNLYSDFIHLRPEGYEVLAYDLWDRFKNYNNVGYQNNSK